MTSISRRLPTFIIALGLFFSLTGIFSWWLKVQPHQVLGQSTSVPLKSLGLDPPAVTAQHILIKDLTTGEILYAKSADTPVPPASTTKMMTALVAVQKYGWDREITVDKSFRDGSVAGFRPGEKYTVEQLVYSLLLKSANDAAEILAENHPQGRDGFVADMNAAAKELGLTSTTFQNPSGLDQDNHLSSASDLARLGEYLVKVTGFDRIVATQNATIIDLASRSGMLLSNSNPLLGKIPGVLGIKTGFTDGAGQSLVSLIDRGGRRVIIVVLGSTDREKDSEKLIDWVYKNFTWQ